MKAPDKLQTERLLLRKPSATDAQLIFDRYASDPEVCRYLSWPMHQSIADTLAFLDFSDTEWRGWPAGPYLIFSASGQQLLGSTGLAFENDSLASTGYVLARDAWGRGLATEALIAMKTLAAKLGAARVYAHVHPDHRPSQRVLQKAGFQHDGTLVEEFVFPNLDPEKLYDVVSYSWRPDQ
jgi:ribosomal-protein-alanine N-acetyltransferase